METPRCESCGEPATGADDTFFAYDHTYPAQGRPRMMTLCTPCFDQYISVAWSLPYAPDPARERARVLAGEGQRVSA